MVTFRLSMISILTKDLKEVLPKSFVSALLVANGNHTFGFVLFTLLW